MKVFATVQCDHYECSVEVRARISVGYTMDHMPTIDVDGLPDGWSFRPAYRAYGDSYEAQCFCPSHSKRKP